MIESEAARAEIERRAECLDDLLTSAADFVQKIDYLIDQSEGITGLCLSGDFTPWSDARYGGPLGSGMAALENLRAAIAKAKGK